MGNPRITISDIFEPVVKAREMQHSGTLVEWSEGSLRLACIHDGWQLSEDCRMPGIIEEYHSQSSNTGDRTVLFDVLQYGY